ncbi:hypothetical protein [Lacticaseibacillus jixiensis]|uniref:hypothetical protein n=1 Tax=Lacticaseibacillus jixiensis TaxID=3231926 RepID=UPI0036F30498
MPDKSKIDTKTTPLTQDDAQNVEEPEPDVMSAFRMQEKANDFLRNHVKITHITKDDNDDKSRR